MRNTGILYSSTERKPVVLPELVELLPPLSGEQLAALEADLLHNGCYSPIIVNEDLVIVDQGLTNLLFPFDRVKLDVGKLATWRLQTHAQFGGTWLSDYVPNQLGGYLVEQKKPSMRLEGQDGNIFNILGRASRLLKEAGQKGQADEMFRRVTSSGSYEEALHIISEYVETELSDDTPSPKSHQKKKGKCAYER